MDPEALRNAIRRILIANYKTSPKMKFMRDHDLELHYEYRDKNGESLLEGDNLPPRFLSGWAMRASSRRLSG